MAMEKVYKCVTVFKYAKYMRHQRRLVLSPKNRWFAGEAFGHSPTEACCWYYWRQCGAAQRFNDRCAASPKYWFLRVEEVPPPKISVPGQIPALAAA
jgi:hypothetical protein